MLLDAASDALLDTYAGTPDRRYVAMGQPVADVPDQLTVFLPSVNPDGSYTAEGIINDVTLGTYSVDIDETTANEQFLAAQFAELLELKGIGIPIPDDFLIDASSLVRKEELRAMVAQAREAAAAAAPQPGAAPGVSPPPTSGTGPGGSVVGQDGGSLPAAPGGSESLSGL